MQDFSKLSKTQLQELVGNQAIKLATKEEPLTEQAKEVLRRDDVIQQLEAKIKELENDYLKVWPKRSKSKRVRLRQPNVVNAKSETKVFRTTCVAR